MTTNNSVYNKIRIGYYSSCGVCGLGSRCNKRYKGNRRTFGKWRFYHRDGLYRLDSYEYVGRYPSWKLASKNKKQWMKKPIIVERDVSSLPWYNELRPDDVTYRLSWD